MREEFIELLREAFKAGEVFGDIYDDKYSFKTFIKTYKDKINKLTNYKTVICGDLIRHNYSINKIGSCILCDKSINKK